MQLFEIEEGHFQRGPPPYICELHRVHVAVWKVITVAEETAARLEVGERVRV